MAIEVAIKKENRQFLSGMIAFRQAKECLLGLALPDAAKV